MLECRLSQGSILKKILDAIRELIVDTNFDASEAGISLQSMDSSHVSLVNLHLREDGFDQFRCDRNLSLGINLPNMAKILKCCTNEDSVTLRANEDEDSCTFLFESPASDRISEFSMKLMDIDSEHLGIPETEYMATVRMSSGEFQRIMRDLSTMGDTCAINATKEGVTFSVSGEGGSGNVTIKQQASADKADEGTFIDLQEPVKMTFALRYLNFFTKATPLSSTVTIAMSPEVPLLVEYKIENIGHIRYYLAPKIDEDEED